MSPSASTAFRTHEASAYLKERGVTASVSLLTKIRGRGTDDPRDKGPDFYRDERSICWYTRDALNRYIESRLALRQFRGPASQPANFRKPEPPKPRRRRGGGARP